MDIPVDWNDERQDLDPDAIREFQSVLTQFLNKLSDRNDLIDGAVCIATLLKAKGTPPFPSLPLPGLKPFVTLDRFNQIKAAIEYRRAAVQQDGRWIEQYMAEEFWIAERQILQDFDLNQASIQIVIERLQRQEGKIVQNCVTYKTLSRSKWERSLDSAKRMASQPITAKSRNQYIRTPILARLKDRVIGFATIAADVTSLFVGSDLEVAGFVSTIAGATVATIMPSSSQ